jgi:hypothetical protein
VTCKHHPETIKEATLLVPKATQTIKETIKQLYQLSLSKAQP